MVTEFESTIIRCGKWAAKGGCIRDEDKDNPQFGVVIENESKGISLYIDTPEVWALYEVLLGLYEIYQEEKLSPHYK